MEFWINYSSLKATIDELSNSERQDLVDRLLDMLHNNEVKKPEKHNRKDDIYTSNFNVNLTEDELDDVIEFLQNSQMKYVGDGEENEAKFYYYSDLLDSWIV